MSDQKRPILARGEEYITPHKRDRGMEKKDTRPTFDEARYRLSSEIKEAMDLIDAVPKEFILDEFIVNVRMDVNYSAKSYHPIGLISQTDANDVGSKKWIKEVKNINNEKPIKPKIGKEIFLRVNKDTLEKLDEQLIIGKNFSKNAINDIRSIDSLFYDTHSKLINKIHDCWSEGKVELVLHPFGNRTEDAKKNLLQLICQYRGNPEKVRYKTYQSGITFASALLSKETLKNILKYNPIRTAHPIIFKQLPSIRSGDSSFKLPSLPLDTPKSSIKVGIFDGGIDISNPYLKPFSIENNPIKTSKDMNFINHGTGVGGAILYGDLSKYGMDSVLPIPTVNIESFRVFPLSDEKDIDLYEVIDIIEDTVPKRPDISVYNLSAGPYGAIDDDNITRFTYAIDKLSKSGEPLFTVAVGNDGDLGNDDLCRIQAPSDAVNCVGIGAYCKNDEGAFSRAEYSSYGDGREGCKIKPDLLDFGGNYNNPFQLISADGRSRNFSCGTSFSTPLVSAKAAEIIGRCNFGNALLARALLVHTAQHPEFKADKYMGHGIANQNAENILSCGDNCVTTIYQSKLRPTQSIKLPFLIVENLKYKGKVIVEWTIVLSTEVDAKQSEDYTLSCIEDTFYPNIYKYTFYKDIEGKRKTKTINIVKDRELVKELIKDGWISSKTPKTFSQFSNKYKTEEERKQNFKWDTIIKRRANIKYENLKKPYLVLHAMERYNSNVNFVNYAVVATMNYIGCEEDVYSLTLKSYNKLEVTRIKAVNEILVK